jgi:cytochrome P450
MLDRWEPYIGNGRTINIAHETARLTLSVATQALLGSKVQDPDRILETDVDFLTTDTAFRFEHPFYPPHWVPFGRNRQFNAALRDLDKTIYAIIAERNSHPEQSDDLLSMLMQAQDNGSGNKMSDAQLRDEVVTLFIAGHETSAEALSWTLFLLSQHPEVEAKLRSELDDVLTGRPPTLADLPQLVYTRMVMDESMRLYPPAWLLERKALADDEIGGYLIPKGMTLAITQYVTHRHPQFWENPAVFDPQRFDPRQNVERPRYAYFPFGGGPRMCIGKGLALLEVQMVLCMLLQRFKFRVAPGWEVKTEPELSLRLKGGLPMQLEPV